MYFEIIRQVLDEAIDAYASDNQLSRQDILPEIRKHIDKMEKEHRKASPQIEYSNPLCRLGYLYRHVGVGATFFEKTLGDKKVQAAIVNAIADGALNVCCLGGGPGTEMLGIGKYLLPQKVGMPIRINFTVLDNVSQWAETWMQLAGAVEREMEKARGSGVVISRNFHQVDVLDPASYRDYSWLFRQANVVVCNQLLSENKNHLGLAKQAIQHLASRTSDGCVFVVIDRLEYITTFQQDVVDLFESIFGPTIKVNGYSGIMDSAERADALGEELRRYLGSPRLQFRTRNGEPTVFWFAVTKN